MLLCIASFFFFWLSETSLFVLDASPSVPDAHRISIGVSAWGKFCFGDPYRGIVRLCPYIHARPVRETEQRLSDLSSAV